MTFTEYVKLAMFAPTTGLAPAAPKINTGAATPPPAGMPSTPAVRLPATQVPSTKTTVPTMPKPKMPKLPKLP